MEPFTTARGPAAWLPEPNVDTDVIIRIERITQNATSELGRFAFEALRFLPDGSDNPDFVLNQSGYRGAEILIAGANFGCGSSREAAVNAIMGMGIRVVIAPSFGDIFFSNCFQAGLLPIRLEAPVVAALGELSRDPAASFIIDLEAQRIVPPSGESIAFEIEPHRRTMLLEGLDEIRVTLKDVAAIHAWQLKDRQSCPWIWDSVGPGLAT